MIIAFIVKIAIKYFLSFKIKMNLL